MDEVWDLIRGEDARRCRRTFSRVGWAVAAMVVFQVGGQYLLQYLTLLLAPGLLNSQPFLYLLAAVSTYGLGFPAALLVLHTLPVLPTKDEPRPLSGRQVVSLWFLSLGWLYLSNLLTLTLMEVLSTLRGIPIANPLDSMGSQPVLFNLILGCVLAPVAEELCFRRAMIDRLRPWGRGFAVFASSLLFALIHGNLYQMIYAFTVGTILGWVYLYTGQIRWTILLHSGLNLVSAGLAPLLGLLGPGGDGIITLLVLVSMVWAICWVVLHGQRLLSIARNAGWGSGEVWGHFVVNPGITVFVLSIIGVVWLTMFR